MHGLLYNLHKEGKEQKDPPKSRNLTLEEIVEEEKIENLQQDPADEVEIVLKKSHRTSRYTLEKQPVNKTKRSSTRTNSTQVSDLRDLILEEPIPRRSRTIASNDGDNSFLHQNQGDVFKDLKSTSNLQKKFRKPYNKTLILDNFENDEEKNNQYEERKDRKKTKRRRSSRGITNEASHVKRLNMEDKNAFQDYVDTYNKDGDNIFDEKAIKEQIEEDLTVRIEINFFRM